MPKFTRKSSGGKKRTYAKKRTYKKKPKMTFAKKVMSVVSRVAENKKVSATASSYFYAGSTIFQIPLVPNASSLVISQGTGQGDRIGNKIKTKRCIMRYIIYPTSYNATSNPTPSPANVRIFIGRNKVSPANSPVGGTTLFQNGDSSNGLTGGLADCIMPLNRDVAIVYKEIHHKVGHAHNVSAGGGQTFNQMQSNTDYKMNVIRTLDVTKYVPSTITYSDGVTAPTCPSTWFNIWYANADNSIDSATAAYAIWWSIQYEFEDM